MKLGLIVAAEGDLTDLPPLGLGFLAANIKRSLPEVEVLLRERLEDLLKEAPDLIGISATTETYALAVNWARAIKAGPGVPVILGGIHISLAPGSLAGCFDLAVIGEGEVTIVEVLRSYLSRGGFDYPALGKIPGVAFLREGGLYLAPERPLAGDLDQLARPREELAPYYQTRSGRHIFSARGCPYRCDFCASSRMFSRYRPHSPDVIADDIEYLVSGGHSGPIIFYDDLFISDKRRLGNLISRLDGRGLLGKARFTGAVRADLVDEETCRQLNRLGMDRVAIGLETFSDRVLRSLNKAGASSEANQRALDLLARHGIGVLALFIFGTAAETAGDVHFTLERIFSNVAAGKIGDAYWGLLTPYPGTRTWEQALERGIVAADMDWSQFSGGGSPALYLGTHLSRPALAEIIEEWRAKLTLLRPGRISGSRTSLFINDEGELGRIVEAVVRRRGKDLGARAGDALLRDAYAARGRVKGT
ncbi:MAG: B12-binding domain-containing radical SAM protein [Elusimicrobia bacterium]|nr:B12-binding domain-containing radical SAM protein [Elusimicrobiota bacterium]